MKLYRGIIGAVTAMTVLLCSCTDSSDGPDTSGPSTPRGTPGGDGVSETFTVVLSGDVLLHTGTWESAEADAAALGEDGLDFAPMFASMKPVVEDADLAICHMETPLASPAGPFENYPVFSAPPQVLRGLKKTGYDACTTASNHSVDKGFEGLTRTIRTFRRNQLPFSGTAATRRQARSTPFVDAAGLKVALLSYTYGTNGMPVDEPWSVNLIDPRKIRRDAAQATRRGADLVLVALHDGTEYVEEPSAHQRAIVDEITRSDDIDLVYGHHAHTSQPFDIVNGTWVAYGLGNFIAQQETVLPETYRGTTARFTFERDADGEWSVSGAEFIPTQITRGGEYDRSMRVLDARAALTDPGTPANLLPKLRETISAIRDASYALGARRDGLRMARG